MYILSRQQAYQQRTYTQARILTKWYVG